jgi:hypothetical protein
MPVSTTQLSIVGQGTIAVNSKSTQSVHFFVSTKTDYPTLSLKITKDSVAFSKKTSASTEIPLPHEVVREEGSRFIPAVAPTDGTVYWLSIDRSNWVLRYGKYYTSKALTLVEVNLDPKTNEWLEKLTTVKVTDDDDSGVCASATIFYPRTPS